MSCKLSKAPINIPNKSSTKCVEKCNLVFNYGQSSVSLKNNGDYISLGYDASTTNVLFNTLKMEVEDIRIYTPSLHTYDGVRSDAEMVIVHSGFGQNLLVCIPMKSGESSDGGSALLSMIFDNAAKKITNTGDATSMGALTWSLNDFVPNKKPLFSYTSTLPYRPCTGSYNYVVWNVNDYFIPISKKTIALLQGTKNKAGLINKQQYEIKTGPDVFYNKYGAVNSTFAGDDDDIYIECKPTGDEGEVLYTKNMTSKDSTSGDGGTSATSSDGTTLKAPTFEEIMENPATEILIGLIAAYIVFTVGKQIYKKIKSD